MLTGERDWLSRVNGRRTRSLRASRGRYIQYLHRLPTGVRWEWGAQGARSSRGWENAPLHAAAFALSCYPATHPAPKRAPRRSVTSGHAKRDTTAAADDYDDYHGLRRRRRRRHSGVICRLGESPFRDSVHHRAAHSFRGTTSIGTELAWDDRARRICSRWVPWRWLKYNVIACRPRWLYV